MVQANDKQLQILSIVPMSQTNWNPSFFPHFLPLFISMSFGSTAIIPDPRPAAEECLSAPDGFPLDCKRILGSIFHRMDYPGMSLTQRSHFNLGNQ